jgi:amidase
VRDTATLLDCVHGVMPGDPYTASTPARPFREEVGSPPERLHIGVMDTFPDGLVHADCREAARLAGSLLERLGHAVEASHPHAITEQMGNAITVVAAWQAHEVDSLGKMLGRQIRAEDMDSDNWALTEMGKAITARDYLDALGSYNTFSRSMASWWANGFDILVTPTITRPSPKIGELVPDPSKPLDAFRRSAEVLTLCAPFNITGQPAISLPLHWNREGLPIGVQFVAAMGREDLLIRLAAQLENEVRWSERRPPIHA